MGMGNMGYGMGNMGMGGNMSGGRFGGPMRQGGGGGMYGDRARNKW